MGKNIPFASKCDNGPSIALLIDLLLNLCAKRNRAHNPVAKLLVQYRLERVSIVLHNLVKSVDQRIFWRHWTSRSSVRVNTERLGQVLLGDVESGGEDLYILRGSGGLPIEESRNGDLGTVELLCKVLESEVVLGFGLEEELGGGREVGFELALDGG